MPHFNKTPVKCRIAYFISPHGFGHAARAASVMEAINEIEATIHFEIFTTVPPWFFEDSLSVPFAHHALKTDIGVVQKSPLEEDIDETIQHLSDFLPFGPSLIARLAQQLRALRCGLVICDIAPMGILAAQNAGMRSVLVENFTWDWIYKGYQHRNKRINDYADYLRSIFDSVNHHIQAEPLCRDHAADLVTAPVSRRIRTPPEKIRRQLRIPLDAKVILITMGGIPEKYAFIQELKSRPEVYFIVPGGSEVMALTDNLVLLPHHSVFYHPDLVNASDAVIGKLGYSTLAEVYHAGVPFGYVPRPDFRESEYLATYVERNMPGMAIAEEDFLSGHWISQVPELLTLARIRRGGPNGSKQIADYVWKLLKQDEDRCCTP